jgi:hypothetical protein
MPKAIRPRRRDFFVAGLTLVILLGLELGAFKAGVFSGSSPTPTPQVLGNSPLTVTSTTTETDPGTNNSLVEFEVAWQPTTANQTINLNLTITSPGAMPLFLSPVPMGTKTPVVTSPFSAPTQGWITFEIPNGAGLSSDGVHHAGTLQATISGGPLLSSVAVVW